MPQERPAVADSLAEGVGFEPTEARRPQRLSRPSHSSALASFRRWRLSANVGQGDRRCELSVADQRRSVSGVANFPHCEPQRFEGFDGLTRRSW